MKKNILILFLFFVFSSLVYGEESITLNEAINVAIKSNHYVKASEYGLMTVKYDKEIAKDSFYPKLYFEEKFTVGNYNSYSVFTKLNQERLTMDKFLSPGETHNFQTTVCLETPLYVRELFVNKRIKNKIYLSATKDFERVQEDIAFQVFKSYLDVIRAKSIKEVAEKSYEDAKEINRIATIRSKTGLGIKSDELRAFVFMKDKEAQLIKAENDLNVAKMALGLILSKEQPIDTANTELSLTFKLPDVEEAITAATSNRKDLIANAYNVETAKDAIDFNKSKYYPKVFLSANYYNDDKSAPLGRDGSGYVASVYLRWEIFDKTRYDETKKSKLEYMKAQEFYAQKEKEVRFHIKESYMRVEEAKKKLQVAEEALKEAEETFRLIKLRYENNLSTMVEILDAEVALYSAKTGYVSAKTGYYEAMAKALYESGLFLKTILGE